MNNAQGQGDSSFWNDDRPHGELNRLKWYTAGEVPPGPAWKIVADLGNEPEVCFKKVMDVIEKILTTSRESWPDADNWKVMLPGWFLEATQEFTQAEYSELLSKTSEDDWDTLPWDFESWLNAIHVRDWQWWSYIRNEGNLEIQLTLTGWPAHLEAFEHILEAAGANISSSREVR